MIALLNCLLCTYYGKASDAESQQLWDLVNVQELGWGIYVLIMI